MGTRWATLGGEQEDFRWALTSQEGKCVTTRTMNKLLQTHTHTQTKTEQENKTCYINCKKEKIVCSWIVSISQYLSSRSRKKTQEHWNKKTVPPRPPSYSIQVICASFPPQQFSCAVSWAGISLLSKHIVLDSRQPFWLWLASLANILSPKGYFMTLYPAHSESNGAAQIEGTAGAWSGRTQAMEEISLRFCSLQKRVLGEGRQLLWLLG